MTRTEKAVARIKKPGLYTTVQDGGRVGFQKSGIVVSGAMDTYAYRMSNLLVGNVSYEAVLEVTLMGPTIEIVEDAVLSICGGNLSPTLDGQPIEMWKAFRVKKNQTLSFGKPQSGARAYIAFQGGLSLPNVLGSYSTYEKATIGGVEGRALQKGDVLYQIPTQTSIRLRKCSNSLIPTYKKKSRIRVIAGPDEDRFTSSGRQTFWEHEYEVSVQSDRMGYRLVGPKIEHQTSANILSDAVTFGTIQVPDDGYPIIMMADRQTTGGYTRIGTIISVDLPYVAQMKQGDVLQFEQVSVETAQQLYLQRESVLKTLAFF
ncbi:biotin-dependent carboxyltransferase family protein [Bacillus alkalicellulosilyticus]|uniref:5-oxoprolinase subunit C family protein n=1 Tax=Alkalihalobacterium alkalicellulosilyticum TaxID=1912214 RepID=UPI000997B574|nr:biotin-dependent carboxyltransferase family protein [Bacillus alkalicellulosilyticus]